MDNRVDSDPDSPMNFCDEWSSFRLILKQLRVSKAGRWDPCRCYMQTAMCIYDSYGLFIGNGDGPPLSVYPIDNDCRRVARAQLASLFIWPKQRWARDPSLLIQALDNWHLRCYPLSFKTSQCSRIWVILGPFLQSNKWVPWKPLDKEKHPYEDEWFTWLTLGMWVLGRVCW